MLYNNVISITQGNISTNPLCGLSDDGKPNHACPKNLEETLNNSFRLETETTFALQNFKDSKNFIHLCCDANPDHCAYRHILDRSRICTYNQQNNQE